MSPPVIQIICTSNKPNTQPHNAFIAKFGNKFIDFCLHYGSHRRVIVTVDTALKNDYILKQFGRNKTRSLLT
jgi:hypothetical protein